MKIVIDIDGTICSHEVNYVLAHPYTNRIKKINQLHDEGNEIVFFTARGSETGKDWRVETEKQFAEWRVKYHKLIFGKPTGDIYIDDRAEKDDFLGDKK